MSEPISFTVPLVPPSVNRVWRKRKQDGLYLVGEAKAFYEAVAIFARGKKLVAKRYQVNAEVFLAKGQKLDLDNAGKCLLDSLQKAGVITSDSKVYALQLMKHRDAANPRTEFKVLAL